MNSVRRAEARDIPAILDLLVQVDMVHHNGRPDLFKGPTTKYDAAELAAILADEEMVEHTTVYIDDICVDENARGQGVGKALYEHILAFAREKGAYNVTLNVWNCNPGAMAFYEKLGMAPYKVGMEKIL